MKLDNVFKALEGYQKGSYCRVGWKSNIESASARKQGVEVLKVCQATVRIGISYKNIYTVKLKRATEGEAKPHNSWFKHLKEMPAIIEHLSDMNKKYLQMFTVNKHSYPKAQYFINGKEVSKKEVMESGYCNASTFTEKEETVMFNIPVENLQFIGKNS